jgi:7-cyano-7-deazaguanine reductase
MTGKARRKPRPLAGVRRDVLAAKPYEYAGMRDVEIAITQPEFTALCPMTGLPDFGTIIVNYVPNRKIVELKSLKLYLLQYRQAGVFYEHVVNRILDDLVAVVRPRWMEVHGEFTPRGGMSTTVTALYEEEET